jgi:hypothetical protein
MVEREIKGKMTMAKPDDDHELSPEVALLGLRAIAADLHRQRGAAVTEQLRLADQRKHLARTALTGSAADRKALDAVTAEAAKIALRIEEIAFADDAVTAEIATATAAVKREEAAARGRHIVKVLLPAFRASGQRMARGISDFAAGYAEVLEAAKEINRYGGTLGREVLRSNLQRSVQAQLFLMGRLNSEPLPRAATSIPTVEALIEKFAETISARASSIVNGESAPRGPAPGQRIDPAAADNIGIPVDDGDDGPDFPRIPGEEFLDPDPVNPVDDDLEAAQ